MKNLLFITMIAFSITSCHNTETNVTPSNPVPKAKSIKVSMLNEAKDFVCDMSLDDEILADTAHYNGKVYGFCNTGCKEEFLKNPEETLKK